VLLLTDGLGADSADTYGRYFDNNPHQLIVVGVGTAVGAAHRGAARVALPIGQDDPLYQGWEPGRAGLWRGLA